MSEATKESPAILLDNVLLLAINETAFTQGYIDEATKEAIQNEIIREQKSS